MFKSILMQKNVITVLLEHWYNVFFLPGNQQKICPGKLILFSQPQLSSCKKCL